MRWLDLLVYVFTHMIAFYSVLLLVISPVFHFLPGTCEDVAEMQLIALGLYLFFFSFASGIIVGSNCGDDIKWLKWLCLVVIVIVVLLVLSSVIFVFVVTGKGGNGDSISGKAYKEYRLQYYSSYLQNMVNNGSKIGFMRISIEWKERRSCLVDLKKVCKSLIDDKSLSAIQFYASELSPIQSGCCKPSNDCGFAFVTPTNWTKPTTTTTTYSNSDCALWNNDNNILCYDCNACKAAVVQSIRVTWRRATIINIGFITFFFIVIPTIWIEVIRRRDRRARNNAGN